MNRTSIEWTDATWNPIRGCSRVSEGCRNCYAEKVAYRFSGERLDGKPAPYEGLVQRTPDGMRLPLWNGQVRFIENHLLDPLKWKEPRRIFVNSMSDLFHDNVPGEWIDRIFAVMALCPQHTFQVLTKRPKRMLAYLTGTAVSHFSISDIERAACDLRPDLAMDLRLGSACIEFPLNVWLGVSVENQGTADERIPLLLKTPAAIRFISAEPLLGPIVLSWPFVATEPRLDWAIIGGESGKNARPMHPDWARALRDQCVTANVPYFFKQWGEWLPDNQNPSMNQVPPPPASGAIRVGKKAAGALLDGREWREFPEVKRDGVV